MLALELAHRLGRLLAEDAVDTQREVDLVEAVEAALQTEDVVALHPGPQRARTDCFLALQQQRLDGAVPRLALQAESRTGVQRNPD